MRHGFNFPVLTALLSGAACVGLGQTIGKLSRRATRKTVFLELESRNPEHSLLAIQLYNLDDVMH